MTRLMANAELLESCSSSLSKSVESLGELGNDLDGLVKSLRENQALDVLDYDDKVDAAYRAILAYADDIKECAEAMGYAATCYRDAEALVLGALDAKDPSDAPDGGESETKVIHHYSQNYEVGVGWKYFGISLTVNSPLAPLGEYAGAALYAVTHGEDFNPDEWESPWIGFKQLLSGDVRDMSAEAKVGGSLAKNRLEARFGTEEDNVHIYVGEDSANAALGGKVAASKKDGKAAYELEGGFSLINLIGGVGRTSDGTRNDVELNFSMYGKGAEGGGSFDANSGSEVGMNSPFEHTPFKNMFKKGPGKGSFGLHYKSQNVDEIRKNTSRLIY